MVSNHGILEGVHRQTTPGVRAIAHSRHYAYSARRAAVVIANTSQTKADLVHFYGIPEEKIRVIWPAIDARFRPAGEGEEEAVAEAAEALLGARDPYFLFVGKLSGRRHVPELVEAFAQAAPRGADGRRFRLLMAGPNLTGVSVERLAGEFGVTQLVRQVDFLEHDTLALLYRGARALLMPTSKEAFSRPIAEAMASGCPVMALDGVPVGIPEYVAETTGESAADCLLRADDGSVGGLRDAIERLGSDDELCARLRLDGLRCAATFPAADDQARRVISVLAEVAAEGRTVSVAPGALPDDYHRRIHEVEEAHWWHRGMRRISEALLGERLDRPGQCVLDAGCGTGGFLRSYLDRASVERACAIDVSDEAVELARLRVPEAELAVAPLKQLPFEDESFDLVFCNDVLQHVPEPDVPASMAEIRRVLRPDGALLLRTNGARLQRRERVDWRAYDDGALGAVLRDAGFHVERLTYANVVLSVVANLRGQVPHAATAERHGIPAPGRSAADAVKYRLLRAEAAYLRPPRRRLPVGHSLLAVAVPDRDAGRGATVASFWDEAAARYDSAYGLPNVAGDGLRERQRAAVRLLGDRPGEVLDAGMGPGRLLEELAGRGWTVAGVDVSAGMVERARERLPQAADDLLVGEIEALPFPDESFDAVVATGVLEYVDYRSGALAELVRVLRPGGLAVISIPNRVALRARFRRVSVEPLAKAAKSVAAVGRPPRPPGVRPARRQEFTRAVEETGLRIEATEHVHFKALDSLGRVAAMLGGPVERGGLSADLLATWIMFAARKADGDR